MLQPPDERIAGLSVFPDESGFFSAVDRLFCGLSVLFPFVSDALHARSGEAAKGRAFVRQGVLDLRPARDLMLTVTAWGKEGVVSLAAGSRRALANGGLLRLKRSVAGGFDVVGWEGPRPPPSPFDPLSPDFKERWIKDATELASLREETLS